MNRVELLGTLTKDPEMRLAGTTCLTEFTIAVNGVRFNRESGEQEIRSIFVSGQAWADLGERLAEERLEKGDTLHVVGELDQVQRAGRDVPSTRVAIVSYTVVRKKPRHTTGSPW